MRKPFLNKDILITADALQNIFLATAQEVVLPVTVNFYLQKNIKTILEAATDIEEARVNIGKQYGEYDAEDESYLIKDPKKLEQAQKDLNDLLSLEQILEIYMVTLKDLKDTSLTVAQMNAIMFMIREE